MSRVVSNVIYKGAIGKFGTGDLFLPSGNVRALALVIHGGAWVDLAKERMIGICNFLNEMGIAAFSVNYRLIDQWPWPVCGDDCLTAFEFIGDSPLFSSLPREKILTVGASAGGHLALMTGIQRPASTLGIISIAGPSDLKQLVLVEWFRELSHKFFGRENVDEKGMESASPAYNITHDLPPLFVSHDRNDSVVPFAQATTLVDCYRETGNFVDFYSYSGPGHVMWKDDRATPLQLLDGIQDRIKSFLSKLI